MATKLKSGVVTKACKAAGITLGYRSIPFALGDVFTLNVPDAKMLAPRTIDGSDTKWIGIDTADGRTLSLSALLRVGNGLVKDRSEDPDEFLVNFFKEGPVNLKVIQEKKIGDRRYLTYEKVDINNDTEEKEDDE